MKNYVQSEVRDHNSAGDVKNPTDTVVNQKGGPKDTAEFKTFVNQYSLSQSNIVLGQGIPATAEPGPGPEIKKENVNNYSWDKNSQLPSGLGNDAKSDNINQFSLSKIGKGLA